MPIYYLSLFSLCFKDACPLPGIRHGKWESRIDATQNRRIHVAKYRCHEGYLEADFEERRCSPDGILDSTVEEAEYVLPNAWTGEAPECLLKGMIKLLSGLI